MLEIEDLSVDLAGRNILSDVTFTAYAGEVLAICGPNGAGKSTLLRAILGDIASAGTIQFDGIDARKMPLRTLSQKRAVLAQETHVAFDFTVKEIVEMGAQSGANAVDMGLVLDALQAVGLQGFEARAINSLSGGERQRVHLARALAQVWNPIGPQGARWLFLDEPVSSLDLGHQIHVMELARHYADAGGGVIAVMHDLNLSAKVADRMAFIDNGSLADIGAPSNVITSERLLRSYGCSVSLNTAPTSGPWFLPQCVKIPDKFK